MNVVPIELVHQGNRAVTRLVVEAPVEAKHATKFVFYQSIVCDITVYTCLDASIF